MHKCERLGCNFDAVCLQSYSKMGIHNEWDVCEVHRLDTLGRVELWPELYSEYTEYELGTVSNYAICH